MSADQTKISVSTKPLHTDDRSTFDIFNALRYQWSANERMPTLMSWPLFMSRLADKYESMSLSLSQVAGANSKKDMITIAEKELSSASR